LLSPAGRGILAVNGGDNGCLESDALLYILRGHTYKHTSRTHQYIARLYSERVTRAHLQAGGVLVVDGGEDGGLERLCLGLVGLAGVGEAARAQQGNGALATLFSGACVCACNVAVSAMNMRAMKPADFDL
jgi:hypothetical protein